MSDQLGVVLGFIPVLGIVAILGTGYFLSKKQYGWSFLMTCITIAASIITLFMILFPRVMISSLNPAWSLTIYNASSSDYTLRIMTIVAVIFVPIVLIYQGWSYWIFRKRVQARPETLTY
jgi:cytochrome d ubiquinol oxidase subunit II